VSQDGGGTLREFKFGSGEGGLGSAEAQANDMGRIDIDLKIHRVRWRLTDEVNLVIQNRGARLDVVV
jgi:hypothetical protein